RTVATSRFRTQSAGDPRGRGRPARAAGPRGYAAAGPGEGLEFLEGRGEFVAHHVAVVRRLRVRHIGGVRPITERIPRPFRRHHEAVEPENRLAPRAPEATESTLLVSDRRAKEGRRERLRCKIYMRGGSNRAASDVRRGDWRGAAATRPKCRGRPI